MNPARNAALDPPRRRSRWRAALAVAGALAVAAPLAAAIAPAEEAQAAAPGPKDTTAVLFQYTWDAIARECTDNLGPAGYGYVQTSPPQEHILGAPWWTSYQPVSYQLESRFGTEAEFQSMVDTCADAGVGVIADVVINHMTGQDDAGIGWAGSPYSHYDYPGLYSEWDFHDCRRDIQGSDYTNDRWAVQECNLVNLADLDTGSDYVRQQLAGYMNRLAGMGVAGFRVDAVKHISAEDLWGIWNRVQNRDDLYLVQEVIGSPGEAVQPDEYIGIGDIHEFAYSRKMKESFGSGSIDWLIDPVGIGDQWEGFLDHSDAAVFVDNHDTERNGETLSYKDGAAYDLAQMFTLAWPYGSPSVHSGYEFSDFDAGPVTDGSGRVIDPVDGQNGWTFTHAQNDIENMVGFRVQTYGQPVTDQWTNGSNAIAFSRGDQGTIAINRGGEMTRTFATSLPDGEYYDVIAAERDGDTWSGSTIAVSGGEFTATVPGDGAVAIHAGAKAEGGSTPTPEPGDDLTVFYATDANWGAYNAHYRIGDGAWTDVPGEEMAAACSGWVSRTIDSDGADVTAAFNDGAGTWDNNGGSDYTLTGTVAAVANGQVTPGSPCD
ncbi:carbohydrate binding domain-containing protein [Microbacterium karelineae]|uniref:carbohydrate binding domain-containing protein n=1 Tax=Microbacterium karelineae TaxID=2654283 RepID=UPI0012EAB1F4|nr:alpha-amylase family glycosyl hydrolase [Microbacterium karelineae]